MPYVTQAQLQDRFGAGDLKQWTDDDASGAVDASVVGSIIADVGAMIDAAASQHYTAPLSLGNATTAAVVRDMAGSLAGYRLATRRHADNVPENLRSSGSSGWSRARSAWPARRRSRPPSRAAGSSSPAGRSWSIAIRWTGCNRQGAMRTTEAQRRRELKTEN